jgi:hypothetical protein
MTFRMLKAGVVLAATAAIVVLVSPVWTSPRTTEARFHLSVMDEVMTSYNGDTNVQFVEIKMLAASQNFVQNTVLGAFSSTGAYLGDVLVVPANVPNSDANVRWLMATSRFQAATGLAPDFIMPASLPTTGGMVCWGAPGVSAPDPSTWDHTNPENYIDCLAYGDYSGPSNSHVGTPTSLNANGHSLQRTQETNDNANDFACADPATPTKNNPLNTSVSMPATTPCGGCQDGDGDGWTDCQESFIETSPSNACNPGGWPPDPAPAPDGNGVVQIDDVAFAAGLFGKTTGDPAYTPRAEIASQNGAIQIDDVAEFAGHFGHSC